MHYDHNTIEFEVSVPSVVTLGKFDGIHLGHRKLMLDVLKCAKEQELRSVVFAINPRQEALILSRTEQKEYLEKLGIDHLIDCPFSPEICRLDPVQFIRDILVKKLNARIVVVGDDFRFGYKRQGDAKQLKAIASEYGIETHVLSKKMYHGREISSTYIREALAAGDMELAEKLLGRPYSLYGNVVHGNHLGSRMGMPTANIVPSEDKYLPPNGVYVSGIFLDDGSYHHGVTNIGTKPTVNGTFIGAETYVFDINESLYDRSVTVELLHYVRPERKFVSIDELKNQIREDIDFGKEYFSR